MTIRVWHLDESTFPELISGEAPPDFFAVKLGFRDPQAQAEAAARLFAKGHYKAVASVQGNDLETAFELTNHIDAPWSSNPGVTALTPNARSSSSGDLFELSDGHWFVCASVGFTPVVSPALALSPAARGAMSKLQARREASVSAPLSGPSL